MRKVEVTEKVTLVCDQCKATGNSSSGWYSFEVMDVNWLRMYEKYAKKSYETKHLVNRVGVDFCSMECAKKYLSESIDRFIMELAPMEDKTKEPWL